jgi:hypothetical protein
VAEELRLDQRPVSRHASGMPIVLASSSPRRRELLEQAGVSFEIMASPAEEIHDAAMKPDLLCELNALGAVPNNIHSPLVLKAASQLPWLGIAPSWLSSGL